MFPHRQHSLKMTEDIIQKMEIHESIARKVLTRITSFNHITTATTPTILPKQ